MPCLAITEVAYSLPCFLNFLNFFFIKTKRKENKDKDGEAIILRNEEINMQKYCRKKCKIGLGCVGHEGKDKTNRDVKELEMSERLSAVLVLAN